MRKICVVITARASYARIKTVLDAVKKHPKLKLQLVVAASALLEKYGSAVDVIRKDGFEPDELAYMVIEGGNLVTAAKSTGLGVVELATIFDNLKPDVVISVADRYETIATAIAASYMNIPLAHVQGGEVSGSIDEKVRHAVTKLADYHFVSNDKARERVKKMGEREDRIFVTGCPSIDLAATIRSEKINKRFNPFENYAGVGRQFNVNQDYLVMMQHPVTTEYKNTANQIMETLHAVEALKMPSFIFWPNVDAGSDKLSKSIRQWREQVNGSSVYFFKNLYPEDFLRLIKQARVLVGNSSVGIRESSYLGIPVVNVGNRQRNRDRGRNVIDTGYNREQIIAAIQKHLSNGTYSSEPLYGDGDAGERIAEHLSRVELITEKVLTY